MYTIEKNERGSLKNEEKTASASSNPLGELPNDLILAKCSNVLSPEGNDQVCGEKKKLTCLLEVSRSTSQSANDQKLSNVEG